MKRGDPVIMNDADAPKTMMVAILTRFDEKHGIWHAEYIHERARRVMTDPYGPDPTPLSLFGKRLEWRGSEYRVVNNGAACTATYQDGLPRKWQDSHSPYWARDARRQSPPARAEDAS